MVLSVCPLIAAERRRYVRFETYSPEYVPPEQPLPLEAGTHPFPAANSKPRSSTLNEQFFAWI